jgi:hypothetical protein
MRKVFYFFGILLIISCSKHDLRTPLELSNFKKLSSNKQVLDYIHLIDKESEHITFFILDTTTQKRLIPVIKISKPINEQKPAVLFLAQQHGNEPSGKEGLLLLLQDLVYQNKVNWLDKFDLYIIPQCNPDGADNNHRRNSNDIDLNRDHLIQNSIEAEALQNLFDSIRPIVTVDFHEYYPYSASYMDFGYRKNFDIQFGGLTNINISENIREYFYSTIFDDVKSNIEKKGYSFFEYTLGNIALGTRLRHSTVDINDGRQSFGICNTMSFIVEGINGKDSIYNIQKRAYSQYETSKAILNTLCINFNEIKNIVSAARRNNFLRDSNEFVAVRMDHFKSNETLPYPMLSLKTGKDTIFYVDEYHPIIKSLLDIKVPRAYLIPKSDSMLSNWLTKSNFEFDDYLYNDSDHILAYKIVDLPISVDEELENYYPSVKQENVTIQGNYYMVPTAQFYKYKVVTALEPQAMYGIVNYPEFSYLLNDKEYRIYRIEY